jgi:polyvinyl alcohol dehydrogenase (cytochrome)
MQTGTALPRRAAVIPSTAPAPAPALALALALALATGLPVAATAAAATAASSSGATVYQQHCASCHDSGQERIPPRSALQQLPAARILRTLDAGEMIAIALTLSADERAAVANYLGTNAALLQAPAAAYCSDRTVHLPSGAAPAWNGWSPAADNARFQPAAGARLTREQVRRLRLKWAFAFAGDSMAFAPPTVIGDELFVGSAGGVVHAMRASSGCLQWTFQAQGPVRSSILLVDRGNGHELLFGDLTGWFYALRAESGELLWKVRVDDHDSARLTGGPAVYGDEVFVPVASWEETRSGASDYDCCTFRGSVVALRVFDGRQLWRAWMTDVPVARGRSARGTVVYGPSGAGVWARPTVDASRGLLYVGTGDNYSAPATTTSDAVVALDLHTGRQVWSRQLSGGDIFNDICRASNSCGPDADIGDSPILIRTPAGRELLLVGQKSGIVWALDPAQRGSILWHARVGQGGLNGGVQWGMASDGARVFATTSDLIRTGQTDPLNPSRAQVDRRNGGGLTALRTSDGTLLWHVAASPCAPLAPVGCSPSQPGAVTEIPGVVFTTSNDGHLRAHAADTGELLWQFDTMRPYRTVDAVPGRGGSMDGPGAVVVNGMVFVCSGYNRNSNVPGNVLLAFSPQ